MDAADRQPHGSESHELAGQLTRALDDAPASELDPGDRRGRDLRSLSRLTRI